MGTYFNPSNESFCRALRSPIYVDKTGLLEILNGRLGTEQNCIALSHARRFGKTQAARMIDAYYSRGCDSRELFSKFEIAKAPDFEEHLNRYNVIHLDISSIADSHKEDLVDAIMDRLLADMRQDFPDCCECGDIERILSSIFERSHTPFVIIIDEWDCVIRKHADRPDLVHRYMQFLHAVFKSEESGQFLALGWVTGILPIKKIEDESALNNFCEYTMLASDKLTPYFGFTEEEVSALCERFGMELDSVKEWYDGYLITGLHMYNPNSVCMAMSSGRLDSYWKNTSAYSTINKLVLLNFEGLKDDIISMLAGNMVRVDPQGFMNDLTQIADKDDALTALIHLGYLAYDEEKGRAYLPNFEVAQAYKQALKRGSWKKIARTISTCEELLESTLAGNTVRVAELVDQAHDAYCSVLKYNDENSLSCALTMAYFTAPAYYDIEREAPAGKGFADLVFRPRCTAGSRPAMVVELKWNKSAETAIRQIKERRYAGALGNHEGQILLVGISYDKDSPDKKHSCVIEKIDGLGGHEPR